jgi:Uma2 family endonuclease
MATMAADSLRRHRLTVADYHQMAEAGILGPDDRVELIAGEVLDMSPIGSLHAAVVAAVAEYFSRVAAGKLTVWSQNPIRLDDLSEPQPDIALVRPRPDFYATAHPAAADVLLVVEVAETSLAYDLDVKVPLYARHGIPEVWVIDAATRVTHRFRGSGPDRYADRATIAAETPLECAALPGDARSLAAILPLPPAVR